MKALRTTAVRDLEHIVKASVQLIYDGHMMAIIRGERPEADGIDFDALKGENFVAVVCNLFSDQDLWNFMVEIAHQGNFGIPVFTSGEVGGKRRLIAFFNHGK